MVVRSLSRTLSNLGIIWLGLAVYICRSNHDNSISDSTMRRFVAWQTLTLSAVSVLLYAMDKQAASRRTFRVPEVVLHVVSLSGGWPGAALSQQWFRHKRRKDGFLRVFVVTVVAYFLLLALFFYSIWLFVLLLVLLTSPLWIHGGD